MFPLVSVILPVHNGAKWLATALRSLNVSTFPVEVIVIDDGSNDASASIAAADSRVTLLSSKCNLGIVASLNRGLDVARGTYIARMDADDICMPNRLARQLSFLRQSGIDLCGSWFVEFGQGLSRVVRWPHHEIALKASMLFQNTICHPTVMARREVFECYRYREEYLLAEDYDLFARASARFRMANVPEPLLRYRRHWRQATQAKREAMELVTRRIRLDALRAQGIEPSSEEQELHNSIRAPKSIRNIEVLDGIEAWLLKLIARQDNPQARRIIASQWLRACIRAAPLGMRMLHTYRGSPLRKLAHASAGATIDIAALATMRLDYTSSAFAILRRLGISV